MFSIIPNSVGGSTLQPFNRGRHSILFWKTVGNELHRDWGADQVFNGGSATPGVRTTCKESQVEVVIATN